MTHNLHMPTHSLGKRIIIIIHLSFIFFGFNLFFCFTIFKNFRFINLPRLSKTIISPIFVSFFLNFPIALTGFKISSCNMTKERNLL